ncbi:MAG: adenosylcobinamide-GDP ribazoletransferase, partial [Eubacteriales bacterium]|nr:adenosylcobinamide-GDP ribazoletransferase [Eubacteriales bacterium]
FRWATEDMKYHLIFFPWIGAVIGLIEYGWYRFGIYGGIGQICDLLVMLAIPILVTGGFHLDGLMDTEDALSSWRSREQRLEILKDPHIGAFSVIRLVAYGLVFAAALSELNGPVRIPWMGTFFLARCLSGFAVVTFPSAKRQGILATEAETAGRRPVQIGLLVESILICGLMIYWMPKGGILVTLAGIISLAAYYRQSLRKFGGITGDLAGWFLCRTELWMTVVIFLAEIIG